jgi:hypothetical protein
MMATKNKTTIVKTEAVEKENHLCLEIRKEKEKIIGMIITLIRSKMKMMMITTVEARKIKEVTEEMRTTKKVRRKKIEATINQEGATRAWVSLAKLVPLEN